MIEFFRIIVRSDILTDIAVREREASCARDIQRIPINGRIVKITIACWIHVARETTLEIFYSTLLLISLAVLEIFQEMEN